MLQVLLIENLFNEPVQTGIIAVEFFNTNKDVANVN